MHGPLVRRVHRGRVVRPRNTLGAFAWECGGSARRGKGRRGGSGVGKKVEGSLSVTGGQNGGVVGEDQLLYIRSADDI